QALLEARQGDPARLAAQLLRFGRRKAAFQGGSPDHPFGFARPRLGLLGLGAELFVDLIRRLVDKRARAEYDLHGLGPRELPTRSWARARAPPGPPAPPSAATPAGGTFPDRPPSKPTSRSMSEPSSSCCRLPFTTTWTGSSPKLR